MVELKPVARTEAISLSRWSRLKRAAAEADSANAVRAEPVEALVASENGNDGLGPNGKIDTAANADYAELPPISAISLAEDFTPFMQAKVPQALKQQALKALFKEPHFNVMDGLDIYIDDYTVFEPISPEVMATLSSWKTIMNPPQQVVTGGGYAVDAESEEGKAVLAAREAALATAEETLPDAAAMQIRAPAVPERAEGGGGDMPQPTVQTSDPSAIDDAHQLSEIIPATATPIPAQNCSLPRERPAAAGAKPHARYGKRVGDFSLASYAAAEQLALDSADTETDKTADTVPQSST